VAVRNTSSTTGRDGTKFDSFVFAVSSRAWYVPGGVLSRRSAFPGRMNPFRSPLEPPREEIAVAVTAGKFFSRTDIILNNGFVTSPHARANAAPIIIGRRSPPIRCITRSAWKVRRSGARRTRTIGRNIAWTTLSSWIEIAANSTCGTKSGGLRILQTTPWLPAKCRVFSQLCPQIFANNILLVSPLQVRYKLAHAVRFLQVERANSGTSEWSCGVPA